MNIVVFNVKYSNNLGDGVVAETTEYILQQLDNTAKVTTIDLGGREDYADVGIKYPSKLKKIVHSLLKAIPSFISSPLRIYLTKYAMQKQHVSQWTQHFEKADRIIIGGGDLISDDDLYFPIRLELIFKEARKYNLPIFFHAVGVTPPASWSDKGRKIFKKIFRSNLIRYISVRDTYSHHNLQDMTDQEIKIVYDPGLFAFETYGSAHDKGARKLGIGIINSNDIAYKAETFPGLERYTDLAKYLVEKGYNIEFFCNGSPEDYEVVKNLEKILGPNQQISFAPCPKNARDLAKITSSYTSMIASRLHACIVATSYGIDVIGVAPWAPKFEGFFKMIQAENRNLPYWDFDNIATLLETPSTAKVEKNISDYKNLLQAIAN
ncbi:MAG: polysaccharide pyruvyl transferase family protein [Pseudomonadota bacterium]